MANVKSPKECYKLHSEMADTIQTKYIWVGNHIKGYRENGDPIFTHNIDEMDWKLVSHKESDKYYGIYWLCIPAFEN